MSDNYTSKHVYTYTRGVRIKIMKQISVFIY